MSNSDAQHLSDYPNVDMRMVVNQDGGEKNLRLGRDQFILIEFDEEEDSVIISASNVEPDLETIARSLQWLGNTIITGTIVEEEGDIS